MTQKKNPGEDHYQKPIKKEKKQKTIKKKGGAAES